MRKISITTNFFMKYGDEGDGFARLRSYGFEACDYQPFANIHDDIYKLSDADFAALMAKVRANADAAGVQIYQAHGPWVWPLKNDTAEGRAEWADCMRRDMEGCRILGCKYLIVHPIMPYGGTSEPDEAEYLRINREFWLALLPDCERTGVTLLLENMPFLKQSLSTCTAMAAFVDEIGSDYFKMCLDTGHALVFGENLGDSVRAVGDRLLALHVHDNDGKGDKHFVPYFGVGDWNAFREALGGIDESVPLSLECTIPASAPAAVKDKLLTAAAEIARSLC